MRFWIIVLLGVSLYVSLSSAMRTGQGRPGHGRGIIGQDVSEHVLEKRSAVAMETGRRPCCRGPKKACRKKGFKPCRGKKGK